MDSDTSDILGGPTSLNACDSQSGWWSSLPIGAKSVFTLVVFFILYASGVRVREIFLVWREKAYKLAMRRRHGIPDNDHRPFNVAYAAVLRARQEGEEKARRVRLQEMVQDAPSDQDLRQRNGISCGAATGSSNSLPGRYESVDVISSTYTRAGGSNHSRPTFASQHDTEDYYNPHPAVRIVDPEINQSPSKSRLYRRAAKYIDDESRRHGSNGGDESDYTRKTRANGENGLRGDEESEWIEENGSRKRGHGDDYDDEEIDDSIHVRDKRQRKVSLDKSYQIIGEDMDIDEDEDEVNALRSFARGKKRDRAEAGSTFGGDDEDDSDRETEQARRRHRKRRTYAKRKDSGVSSRGTKRDRELAEDDSEDDNEDDTRIKASRKKRGKKAAHVPQQDDRSDVSMDESQASSLRGRPKRSIGEEWESNGVKYKIGPNGQRLRQTLVRKERQRFPMPEDSQHPDRQANFEVYVETWLTEEEYCEAKDQQLLAWQDSSKPSAEPQTPTIESPEEVLPVAGKDLLWNSASGSSQPGTSTSRQITPPVTPQTKQRKDDLFGSLASNAGLRANPFANPPHAGKRVASAVRRPSTLKLNGTSTVPPSPVGSIVHSLSDSTNNSPRHKAFSKWEKQDLEAKAMMKMRQANRLKEEERLDKLKKEQEAATAASKVIPTITVTKADDAKPTVFSLAPPAPDATKKDGPNPLFSAGPAKGSIQPPLFAPPTSQPTTKPPTIPTSAPTAGNQSVKPTGFGSNPEHLNSFVSFGPLPFATSTSTSTAPAASTSAPAPAHANPGIPISKSAFSFGPTPPQPQPTQATHEGEKKSEPAAGGSLLSRLSPSAPAPAAQATQPSQAPSAFGFGKPPEAPTFGNSSTTPPSSQPAPSQPATANTGPKFDFGFGKGPAGGATTASSTATSGSSMAKPVANPFAFTPSNTTDNSTAAPSTAPVSTAAGSTTAPKFSFSIPPSSSGSNSFAPKSSSSSGTSSTATNGIGVSTATTTAPAQSGFAFGNKPAGETLVASTPAASPFGAFGAKPDPAAASTATTPAQSSFGAFGAKLNGATTTGPAQLAFGTQPAAAQSAFAFGTKPADNSSTQPAFGVQPIAGTSAPGPAQSPFVMGTSSTTGPTPPVFGTSHTFGSKLNDVAPAPAQSAFGGGFGGSNSASTSSPFGATAGFGGKPTTVTSSATSTASKENASKPIFSFGKLPATSSSTTPLMTPSATPTPSTTAATSGTLSAFGTSTFGPSSSNTFTFGSAAKDSTTPQTSQTTANSLFGKPADTNAFGFGANTFSFGKAPASTGQQQQ